MKKACLIAVLACFSAFFTGCGSSSSDDNNGALDTNDTPIDSSCVNDTTQCDNGQPVCQSYTNNGQSIFNTNAQSTCYPTDQNGQYQESPFGFASGACQCDQGFVPFRQEDGSLGCLRKETVIQTQWLMTVSFSKGQISRRNGGQHRHKSWNESGVDFVLNQGGQTIEQIRPGYGNCYQQLPIGCSLSQPYQSCAQVSRPGMPAVCVPANGGQGGQGICVQQNVPVQ